MSMSLEALSDFERLGPGGQTFIGKSQDCRATSATIGGKELSI